MSSPSRTLQRWRPKRVQLKRRKTMPASQVLRNPNLAKWVRKKVKEYEEEPLDLRKLEGLLKTWQAGRPQMWKRLQNQDLARDLAMVLLVEASQAQARYEVGGLPPTDAREQAQAEWLLLEPETEEAGPEAPEPWMTEVEPYSTHIGPTITSPIQND